MTKHIAASVADWLRSSPMPGTNVLSLAMTEVFIRIAGVSPAELVAEVAREIDRLGTHRVIYFSYGDILQGGRSAGMGVIMHAVPITYGPQIRALTPVVWRALTPNAKDQGRA